MKQEELFFQFIVAGSLSLTTLVIISGHFSIKKGLEWTDQVVRAVKWFVL